MHTDLLDPKNDYVFKRLLADSPALLSSLINAVRHDRPPVSVVRVLNPAIQPEDLTGKAIVLDVLAEDAHGHRFDIEMQARRHPDWAMRSVYYLARTLGQQMVEGDGYGQLRPAIGIHLLDFRLFDDPAQALWRFRLRDDWQPLIRLGDELELNLVELPKAQTLGGLPRAVSAWVTFFERWNEETAMATIQEPSVREAMRRLETLSGDEEARIRAELRQKAIWDEVSARSWERREGRREGREEGRTEAQREILQRMLTRRFGTVPAEAIARIRAADEATLDTWIDRLLTARTSEEVFSSD